MLSILSIIYDFCCTGFRPKEQKIINKIFQDVEDLADYEIDKLLKHLGKEETVNEEMVLADIYNIDVELFKTNNTSKIGFK